MTIRVLIIDDSAFVRQLMQQILSQDKGIEVVGVAPHPLIARQMIKDLNPDVITLDVEMPQMDGLSFLEKIMRLRPMPVVMVSSLTEKGADITLQALELGAVDFVAKPKMDLGKGLPALSEEILSKVKAAAKARVRALSENKTVRQVSLGNFRGTEKIIAIGSSTGGVEALLEVIPALPKDCPGIVITQHMPPRFTTSFAARLDRASAVTVVEAKDNMRILPGHAYLAEGDVHLSVVRSGANYITRCYTAEPVSGHRPSVDVLMHSVAGAAGANAIGVMLTGMGSDGAKGMLAMKQAGAHTIGQDEGSCVVYGMPKAAKLIGAVTIEKPLSRIAEAIADACGNASERAIRV